MLILVNINENRHRQKRYVLQNYNMNANYNRHAIFNKKKWITSKERKKILAPSESL